MSFFQFPLLGSQYFFDRLPLHEYYLSIPFIGFHYNLFSFSWGEVKLSIPFIGFFPCRIQGWKAIRSLSIPFIGFRSGSSSGPEAGDWSFQFPLLGSPQGTWKAKSTIKAFNSLYWVQLWSYYGDTLRWLLFQFPLLGSYLKAPEGQTSLVRVFQFPLLGSF